MIDKRTRRRYHEFIVKKLKTFWYVFTNTFANPAYYAHILKARLSFSLKFYYAYFFFFAVASTAVITIRYLIPLSDFMRTLPGHLLSAYPAELVITIKNGEATTNVNEPYFIPVSTVQPLIEDFKTKVLGAYSPTINNLLVIDTAASVDDFYALSTYALLTKTTFSYINDNSAIETHRLADIEDMTINRQTVVNILELFKPVMKSAVPILAVGIFLAHTLIIPTFGLLYVALEAILVFLIAKLVKFPLKYAKAFQMTMHIVVIPSTVFGILAALRIPLYFPFRDTLIIALISWYILHTLYTRGKLPSVRSK